MRILLFALLLIPGVLLTRPQQALASVWTDGCATDYDTCFDAAIGDAQEEANCESTRLQCIDDDPEVGAPPTSPAPAAPPAAPTTTVKPPAPAAPPAAISLPNPLNTNDPRVLIGRLIQAIISISGAIALVMFIYAGLMFLTSAGNTAMVSKAKMLMLYTILGIIIIAGAFVATNTIFSAVLTGNPVPDAVDGKGL
jgi:hypothetical protein